MNTTKKMELHSSFEELEKVESFLNDLQDELEFSNDNYARMMLSVSEAVTNGVVHGNQLDPEKVVTLSAFTDDDRLFFECRDEGIGFDPTEVPDPLAEENLLKPSGRGIFLMKEYSDGLTYDKSTKTLRMQFNLDF